MHFHNCVMEAGELTASFFIWALCQVLGGDSLNHAPLLDLELFLYLIYFTMILGMANKPSSAHLKIN